MTIARRKILPDYNMLSSELKKFEVGKERTEL